jgi:hypothetical protein
MNVLAVKITRLEYVVNELTYAIEEVHKQQTEAVRYR